MKGYAYLDLDMNLLYRTADYIDNENPGFFSNSSNKQYIVRYWKFDTSDLRIMWNMYSSFQDLKVPVTSVLNFTKSIGFDINIFKNADKV
jgi:hypothetical protein